MTGDTAELRAMAEALTAEESAGQQWAPGDQYVQEFWKSAVDPLRAALRLLLTPSEATIEAGVLALCEGSPVPAGPMDRQEARAVIVAAVRQILGEDAG